MALVAVLVWGAVSYFQLPQPEDPDIPHRSALLVTKFPGASSQKIEDLVTQKLEEKIDELESVEELKSQSRAGVSVITVKQVPRSKARVQQEWDRLRAKLKEVVLPEGCGEPCLDTDFGNTVTLLFAITSPPVSDAELQARAGLIRARLARLRGDTGPAGRAAVFAFFPPAVAESYQAAVKQKFQTMLAAERLGEDIRTVRGESYDLADFQTSASREQLQDFLKRFLRSLTGSDAELHPDFGGVIILMGDEDPLPAIRATALPRYSYRELQLSGEFKDENEMLGAIVALDRKTGLPIYLRDLFDVRRGYETPIPFRVEVLKRDSASRVGHSTFNVQRSTSNSPSGRADVQHPASESVPLASHRSVLLAVEMKEGNIIGDFDRQVLAVVNHFQERLSDGMEMFKLSDQPLVMMLTVPLGLIGAFAGLALVHTSFGFMALLGIVSRAGVMVSHIIVLSDFIEQARAEGMELKQALVQAGLVRLRAVLVTVLATVGGLIPLALTGGELWRPLTTVHIFGLLFATALTLLVLPALYYVFGAKWRWIR